MDIELNYQCGHTIKEKTKARPHSEWWHDQKDDAARQPCPACKKQILNAQKMGEKTC